MTVISSALKPTCSDGVSQVAFYVTIAALVGKILSIKLYFLLQFRTVNINCSVSVENSPTGLPKCINSTCPSESFWQKLPKNCSFPISFGSWTNSFRSFAEEVSGVVKTGFYVCPGTYRGNLHCFEKTIIVCLFCTLREGVPPFSQDISVWVVKIAFYVSIGTFSGQYYRRNLNDFLFFSRHWAEKMTFPQNFQQGLSELRFQCPGEKVLLSVKRSFQPFSEIQRKNSGLPSRTFSAGMSKLHYTCP